MEDNLKKRLCIMEDENGLELSLGLSLGNSSKSCDPTPSVAVAEAGSEEERVVARSNTWLRKPAPVESSNGSGSLQVQPKNSSSNNSNSKSSSAGFRLREFLAPDAPSSQQAQIQAPGAPWAQLMKEHMYRGSHPGNILMPEFAKYMANASSQHEPPAGRDDEQQELETSEQQKKFSQEARKKRKMAMDEQKKKPKDDDKPEENSSPGLPPIHRVASLGAFQNRVMDQGSASMAALTSHLMNMRRTTSDPSFAQHQQQQQQQQQQHQLQDSNKDQINSEMEAAGANPSNSNNTSTESLLGMWQLGTTMDVPSAEMINPELSSIKPGCSADLPWVSANGPGGRSVSGVAYKLFQGQYKIVCSCHGLHMSPPEFIKHAAGAQAGGGAGGGGAPNGNGNAANADAISMLSQVTPA